MATAAPDTGDTGVCTCFVLI